MMFVEDYMSRDVCTVRETSPLSEAALAMQRHRYRQLPVVDASGRLVGIITDRDIRQTVAIGEPLKEAIDVADIMTPDPKTIRLDATLDEAVELFSTLRFGALPVMGEGRLQGIISYIDVLRAFAEVFGLDVPGERIEVALPEGYEDAARAFAALKGSGCLLSAVVSRTRRDGGEPALYLRVPRDRVREVERRLSQATLVLLQPEHK